MVAYDIRPEILSDFTTDKRKVREGLDRLKIAAFSEANLFDAVTDTAERMSDIEGRKAILVLTSGVDTFSKLTYDQTRKKLQEAGVPIYAIGLMQMERTLYDAYMGGAERMTFLQADNQMRTFAKETGGEAYFPQFQGEYGQIFGAGPPGAAESVRHHVPVQQYKHDGAFRKIKVELVNPATNEPLPVKDEKGKPVKYSDRGQVRLQSAARSRVDKTRRSICACQELNLAVFQGDANPLTAVLRLCYSRIRSPNEDCSLINSEYPAR